MRFDPIYFLGIAVVITGAAAILWVYFKRSVRKEESEEIGAAQQSAGAWEKLASARLAQLADCEQVRLALVKENEQLRRERDQFERAIDRRLSEILELHGQIDELKRTRPQRRRGQNEHGD